MERHQTIGHRARPPGLAMLALLATGATALAEPETRRVSVASDGRQANGISLGPSVSASGLSGAFELLASNLVRGDINGGSDIFVHGIRKGRTKRISLSSPGRQGNGESRGARISADGRFVASYSWANNLVAGDTNGAVDISLHERASGTTRRVSVTSAGAQANSDSLFPALSADGRYIGFDSAASNLVDADTNGWGDIFVHDRISGTTERVSVASDGAQTNGTSYQPALSANGRFVGFESEATNLVPGDHNGGIDVLVHELATGRTARVSVATAGAEGDLDSQSVVLSQDGRLAVFASQATNLVPNDTNNADDVFVRDRLAGTTRRASVRTAGGQANGFSLDPSISTDAALIAFASTARNLVPDDTNRKFDVFVRTR